MDGNAIEERKKFVEAWNKTMIDIWIERIYIMKILNTKNLWRSPLLLPVRADGRFYDIELSQSFLEYGLWQDLGVGREKPIGNKGKLENHEQDYREVHNLNKPRKRGPKWGGGMTSGHPREKRRWFSTKYYASVMKLRDFMARSIGEEFIGLFANLDADDYRKNTDYYKRKGIK